MSLPPESIQVGQCYLTHEGRVRRVLQLLPNSRVNFEWQNSTSTAKQWRAGVLDLRAFAAAIERPVSCDWTPETDEGESE